MVAENQLPKLAEEIKNKLWGELKKVTGLDWLVIDDKYLEAGYVIQFRCKAPDVARAILTEAKDLTQYNFNDVDRIAEEHSKVVIHYYRQQKL